MKLFRYSAGVFLIVCTGIVAKEFVPIIIEHPQWRDWTIEIDTQETAEDGSQRAVLKSDEAMSNSIVILRLISCVRKENVESLNDFQLPRLTYRAFNGAEYVCTYQEK